MISQLFKKNGPFFLTHLIDGAVKNIPIDIWTKEDKKFQYNFKEKTTIMIVLGMDEFFMFYIVILQKNCRTPFNLPVRLQPR